MSAGIAETIVTKMIMLLLAVVATPMNEGDTIRVDRLASTGIYDSYEIDRSDEGYTVFEIDGDKRKKEGTIRPTKKAHTFQIVRGETSDTIEVASLLATVDPGELSKLDDKVLAVDGGMPIRLQRSDDLLYLTSRQLDQTFVVREDT